MKKQLLSSLLACSFLIAAPASAKDVFDKLHVPPPSEETSFVMRLMTGAAIAGAIQAGSKYTGVSEITSNSVHAAHLMVQLGQIFGSPVATRVGVNMAITAAASGMATTESAKSYVRMLPVIGIPLTAAQEQGTAIVTGWINDMLGYAYNVVLGASGVGRALGLQEENPCPNSK